MTRKYIAHNGAKLSYLEAGSGRPLVLLHAFPLNAEMWEPQLAAVPSGWRLLAPDLRGFGANEAGRDPARSMDDYADDVIGFIDALGIARPVMGGLSMGGYITFALLRRTANRFAGLVLADTRPGADTEEGRAGRRKMQELAAREGAAGVAREMIPKMLSEETRRGSPAVVSRVRDLMQAAAPSAVHDALASMMVRPDSADVLRQVRVPTLIVVGEHDGLTPVAESERMQQLIPGSTLVIIPAAAHLPNLERPDQFNAALAAFCKELA